MTPKPRSLLEDWQDDFASHGVDRLMVWREDLLPGAIGGAKSRNLRRHLASAKAADCDTLLLAARAGSNLVMAASLLAPAAGMEVHALLRPQPDSRHARHNLAVSLAAGTAVTAVSLDVSLRRAAPALTAARTALRRAGRRVYEIPFAGADLDAGLAHLEAVEEVDALLRARGLEPPRRLYMAAASFASAAGVACGAAAKRWPTRLVLVNVAQDEVPTADGVRDSAAEVAVQAGLDPSPLRDLDLEVRDALAPQFGRLSQADARLVAPFRSRLELDDSYTAKSLAVLLRDARDERIADALFWYGGTGPPRWPDGVKPAPVPAHYAEALLF